MLNVLLQATTADSNGGDDFTALAFFLVALSFFLVLVYFIWSSKKEKKQALDEKELNDEPIEENLGEIGSKDIIIDEDLGVYEVDPADRNRFISKINNRLIIRVFEFSNPTDKAHYSTIFGHGYYYQDTVSAEGFSGKKEFDNVVPEITKITILDSHKLEFIKTGAANWGDIREKILTQLFIHMNKMYPKKG